MTLHLLKLSVGSTSLEDFKTWIKDAKAGRDTLDHTTRSFPRRAAEILPNGSLYWVVKGMIMCRLPIKALEPVKGADGIDRCRIVFKPQLVAVRPAPRRAFQGWRYLADDDAPPDLPKNATATDINPEMHRQLAELGLL